MRHRVREVPIVERSELSRPKKKKKKISSSRSEAENGSGFKEADSFAGAVVGDGGDLTGFARALAQHFGHRAGIGGEHS